MRVFVWYKNVLKLLYLCENVRVLMWYCVCVNVVLCVSVYDCNVLQCLNFSCTAHFPD